MQDLVALTATNATRAGLRSASNLLYQKSSVRTKFGEPFHVKFGEGALATLNMLRGIHHLLSVDYH